MTIKDTIDKAEAEIQKANDDFQKEYKRLMGEIQKAEKKRDEAVLKLQTKRDEAVMKEKLKDFPPELVEGHKLCSICGAEMRPFSYMEEGRIVKAWACQLGSLSAEHDLIRV